MLLLLRFLRFFQNPKKRDFYVFCFASYVFLNYEPNNRWCNNNLGRRLVGVELHPLTVTDVRSLCSNNSGRILAHQDISELMNSTHQQSSGHSFTT